MSYYYWLFRKMLLNTPFSLFTYYFLSSVIQICAGQELYSFRQTTDALQIYFLSEGWLNVSTRGFEGREGIIVCDNISNEAFVEFQINDMIQQQQSVRVNCNNLPANLEDCRDISREFTGDTISNVTCFDLSNYQLGDIRILEDGRIVQLVDRNGYHAWSHFCVEENDNWDINITNLACQTLGYEIASNYFSIEGKYISGLENIDCTGALNFQQCTSGILDSNLQDCFRGAIAIECNGLIATQTISTTRTPTASTTTPTTTEITTQIPLASSTHSPTTPTDSSSTNSVIDPTLATFTEQYKIHIIAGSVATVFLLVVCVLGCVIVIAFCICKSKSHAKSSKDVNKQGVNEESKEYEAYLSMKPHPNQGINKSTNSDLYYNEQNDYQHTYLEMQPGQVETSRDVSTVEPLYSDIYST